MSGGRRGPPPKILAKHVLRAVARAAVAPALLLFAFEARLIGRERAFRGYSQTFSLLPGLLGEALRVAFYRRTILYCAPDCSISFGTILSTTDVAIAEGAYIGGYCILGHCRIGRDALIGSRVSVISGLRQHGVADWRVPIKEQPGRFEVTVIGDDCLIGEGAVVAARVGEHSVVAAGSVVHREVPPYSVVKGNPAVLARTRREGA